MRAGIDWVALALVALSFVLSRARSLSLTQRYMGMALCFAVLALARLRLGSAGLNGLFTLFAGLLALYYAGKGWGARRGL